MTSPNGRVPEGAYVGTAGQSNSITDLNNLTEAEAKRRMQGGIAPAFNRQRDGVWQNGGLLGHIADLLFGTGSALPAQRLSDGMTALNNRLDLMSDISGYCGAFMSLKYRYAGGNNYNKLKLDTLYGPPKNASLDAANHRIVLAKGTWSVSALIAVGAQTAAIWLRGRIDVYKPNGALHTRRWLDWTVGPANSTSFAQVPVVVPDPGYYVEVCVTHNGLWADILGGIDRTLVFVNRWDIRTDNENLIIDPPSGGDVS